MIAAAQRIGKVLHVQTHAAKEVAVLRLTRACVGRLRRHIGWLLAVEPAF
jgi:hypothetical protein